jgi:FkbM family methyltransferase
MRERALVRKIVKAGDRVLEGGGGLGTVTMNLAHIVGPGNLIVYEPSPLAADILEENLRRNGLSAELRRKGLSDRSGGETLVRTADIVGSSSVAEVEGDTIDIATDSLSDVIEEFAPTVLVLDIEGKEIDALCSSPLDGVRTIIVEIHPRECGDAAYNRMYRHLFEAGFVLRHQRSIGRVLLFQRESTGTPG